GATSSSTSSTVASSTSGGGASSSSSTGTGPSTMSVPAALRTQISQQYLSAIGGGSGKVMATAEGIGPDEVFVITDLDGALADGPRVGRAARNGQSLSAVNGGGGALVAGVTQPGDDETFLIHRLAGPGAIAGGDQVALEALHQVEYVSADQGGGAIVAVNEPHALSWEAFPITPSPPPSPPAPVAPAKATDHPI